MIYSPSVFRATSLNKNLPKRYHSTGRVDWAGRAFAVSAILGSSLTTEIRLAGSVASLVSVTSAVLSVPKPLSATLTSVASVPAASLTTEIRLAASVTSVASIANANLTDFVGGGGGGYSLNFSVNTNSMYIPVIGL